MAAPILAMRSLWGWKRRESGRIELELTKDERRKTKGDRGKTNDYEQNETREDRRQKKEENIMRRKKKEKQKRKKRRKIKQERREGERVGEATVHAYSPKHHFLPLSFTNKQHKQK